VHASGAEHEQSAGSCTQPSAQAWGHEHEQSSPRRPPLTQGREQVHEQSELSWPKLAHCVGQVQAQVEVANTPPRRQVSGEQVHAQKASAVPPF
jgi:hypothetical protein